MKIFHLFANHKFTGPADPAMVLAAGQAAEGAEVSFISSTHPSAENTVEKIASQRGLSTVRGLRLSKHFRLSSLGNDVVKLRNLIDQERPDFIHSHLDGDHLLAALAISSGGPTLIRSTYDLDPPQGIRAQWLTRKTDLWITPTEKSAQRLATKHKRTRDRIRIIPPLLDLSRFNQPTENQINKEKFSTSRERINVGVVARMQRHRRFPELIEAFSLAAKEDPRLHLEILGRGTHQEEVAKVPAQDSGMKDRIHFPGYIEPGLYPNHLHSFDMLIFLVPGSDGTCRAAREALACGIPVISSQRGLLPDLIPTTGGLILEDERSQTLARAILSLSADPVLRKNLSLGAKKYAETEFDQKVHIRSFLDDLKVSTATS